MARIISLPTKTDVITNEEKKNKKLKILKQKKREPNICINNKQHINEKNKKIIK